MRDALQNMPLGGVHEAVAQRVEAVEEERQELASLPKDRLISNLLERHGASEVALSGVRVAANFALGRYARTKLERMAENGNAKAAIAVAGLVVQDHLNDTLRDMSQSDIVDAISVTGEEYRGPDSPFQRELIDIPFATVGSICLAPFVAVAMADAVIETGEHPIYRKDRMFTRGVPKARTMAGGDRSEEGTFGPYDARRIGGGAASLTAIDEGPQVWEKVLTGEWSIVGPRDLLELDHEEIFELLQERGLESFYSDWVLTASGLVVKNGLVSDAANLGHRIKSHTPRLWLAKMLLDWQYERSASLLTDLRIIKETPRALYSGVRNPIAEFDNSELDDAYLPGDELPAAYPPPLAA